MRELSLPYLLAAIPAPFDGKRLDNAQRGNASRQKGTGAQGRIVVRQFAGCQLTLPQSSALVLEEPLVKLFVLVSLRP